MANVAIVGSGVSGLCMAIQLKRLLGVDQFEIFEESDNVGGTWYANSYPNCACDIPGLFYSYSFAPHPGSTFFPSQTEIWTYLDRLAAHYGIRQGVNIHFKTKVESAIWEEQESRWLISSRDLVDGSKSQKHFNIFVPAIGSLSIPKECDINGADKFQGKIFHSAKWDHSVSLEDRDVVVIGNGCSASQFVPAIAEKARHLTQFARSPQWYIKMPVVKFGKLDQFLFSYVPGFLWLIRLVLSSIIDSKFKQFKMSGNSSRTKDEQKTRSQMLKDCPKKYHGAIIPDFSFGCKRRVFDPDAMYLKCLHRGNVELSREEISKIDVDGVVSAGHKIHADVIILANGFKTQEPFADLEIRGRNGLRLSDYWKSKGGVQNYKATVISQFPNMFPLGGPYSGSGHTSLLTTVECQVKLVIQLITPIIRGQILAVSVKEAAEEADIAWTLAKGESLVWNPAIGGCSNWYWNKDSDRNIACYPDYQTLYWLRTLWPKWSDFNLKTASGKGWTDGRQFNWWKRMQRAVL